MNKTIKPPPKTTRTEGSDKNGRQFSFFSKHNIKKMIEEYVQNNFVKEGMIVDLAIHDESREGNQNIHAHIMTIVRPINEDGTWGQKSKKEYILDEKGVKILNKNGKPKTRKVELTT